MMVPPEAIALIKRWEGLARIVRATSPVQIAPYLCPADYWTIGYGHRCRPDQPMIDEDQAEALLAIDLRIAEADALKCCPILLNEPPARLAAIVSFTFNLGATRLKSSTLRRRINEGAWPEAAMELRRWVYGGGRKLPGLIGRRDAEARLLIG